MEHTWNGRFVCVLCTVMHNTCTDLPYYMYAYEKYNINSIDMTLKNKFFFFHRLHVCSVTLLHTWPSYRQGMDHYLLEYASKELIIHKTSHAVVMWFVAYYRRLGNFHVKNNSHEKLSWG